MSLIRQLNTAKHNLLTLSDTEVERESVILCPLKKTKNLNQ